MTIGQAIKKCRESKNITQKELARRSGTSQTAISLWETDKINATVFTLICVADVLGVTLDELVGRDLKAKKSL